MHNPYSAHKNETHKILWDFEIQTDYLISVRQPDLVIFNKKKRSCSILYQGVSAKYSVKLKESKKRN